MATRSTNYPFKCGHCDAAFRFEANLEAHVAVRHSDDNAGVAMIQEPRKQCYLLKEVSPNPDYPFRCSVCRAFFSEEANVKSHYETLHLKEQSKKEQFKTQNQAQGQFKAQNEGQGQSKVGKPAKGKPDATGVDRDQKKTRLRCPNCPQTFAARSYLLRHVNHLHKGRGHRCHVHGCGHLARSPGHLRKHLIGHSAVRPFACDQCHKKFKEARVLKKHVNRVHLKLQWPQTVSVYSQKLE